MTRAERKKLALLWILSVVFSAGSAAVCALSWHVHSRHIKAAESINNKSAAEAPGTSAETAAEDRMFLWLFHEIAPGLTAGQQTDLEKIHMAQQKMAAGRLPELREARREIAEALASGNAAAPSLKPALERLARLQAERQQALIACCFEVQGVLQPEQRTAFLQWVNTALLHR